MEEKIKALVEGNLDELRVALPDLTAEELAALKSAEQGQKRPRSGAIDMIDEAIEAAGGAPEQPAPEQEKQEQQPPEQDLRFVRAPLVMAVPSDRRDLIARLATAFAKGDSVAIVMAAADGEVLPVPPIEATAGDFQQFGGTNPHLIYKPQIALGPELPAVAVRQAFLLVAMTETAEVPAAVAVCRLSSDLNAGGGRRAQIPDGNLLFDLS
ncbi:MAG: hypothetical protein WBL20_09530 [Sphingobium sp.]|uniref:hypothetical protein n=1 Tax=Sphingobium sp. TaxID=1912891 RepID=UPI003BB116F0